MSSRHADQLPSIVFWLGCLLLFSLSNVAEGLDDDRPNIILILADDFGVGDIQAHYPSNPIPTPNLDTLVRSGRSFTDAHSPSAVCSPTRYGLLCGRYAWRTPLQEWVIAAYEPPLISEARPTIATMLKQQGYSTSCVGKWHLGWNWPGEDPSRMTQKRNGQWQQTWDFAQRIQGGPLDRGFDEFFGVDLPNLPPFTFIEGARTVPIPDAQFAPDKNEGIVLPNQFTGSPAAPNWKLRDVLPRITDRAVQVVRNRAKEEQPFFLYFSLTSPHEPVVPSEGFRGKSGIAPIADFLMETDAVVGQVLDAVEQSGIGDNTLVIFTADNGHSHYTGWQDLIDAGHMPSGPYRGHKGDIWEGGHRVPLIMSWPDKIAPNSSSDALISLTDIYATLASLVSADLPAAAAEDSIDFLATALGRDAPHERESLVSHSNIGEFAYRRANWKLVFRSADRKLEKARGRKTVPELYDLSTDIGESKNLIAEHPQMAQELTEALVEVIHAGGSRNGISTLNEGVADPFRTQPRRWMPKPLK